MVRSPRKAENQKKALLPKVFLKEAISSINLIFQLMKPYLKALITVTTSHNSNITKKVLTLPSIDDKFQCLRKGISKKGKETHIFKCLIPDCNNRVIIYKNL